MIAAHLILSLVIRSVVKGGRKRRREEREKGAGRGTGGRPPEKIRRQRCKGCEEDEEEAIRRLSCTDTEDRTKYHF